MADSSQSRIGRVRPPRVHITYDVEDGGAVALRELPLVAGVVSNLSGHSEDPVEYARRKFAEVDQGGVSSLMKRIGPTLNFSVPDDVSGKDDSEVAVALKFEDIADFSPLGVAAQIDQTAELLRIRQTLADLYGKIESNERLDGILGEVLADADKQAELRAELDMDGAPSE